MTRTAVRCLCYGLVLTATALLGASDALKAEMKDPDLAAHWIYDDLPAATAQAKASGQPLLVALRCVPCPAAIKLDAALTHPSPELEAVEKQFVCVRVVKNQGLDQRIFQFDGDNSLVLFFLNADGTIYGRYGSRNGNAGNSDNLLSEAAARRAMERALVLHRAYPGNKAQLAGKRGPAPEYALPEQIPGLTDRAVEPVTRKACIHCHMIRERQITNKYNAGTLKASDLFVYPLPDNIGLKIAVDDGRRVEQVAAGSPAAKAGLAAGDELLTLNGQPLTSVADMQWVLNALPEESTLTAQARRGAATLDFKLALSGPWRESDLGWRSSTWAGLRHGLLTVPLTAEERQALGVADGSLALAVKQMYGNAAQVLPKAGLKTRDVIVSVGDKARALTESQFLVHLRTTYGPGDPVKVTVLRDTQRLELTLPPW
ncbi:MAG: PDZ domain-containing protein [Armatimonadetes bacterium]|nr:PDZ domain-containing protein [Armatimonadota bacterium]